MYINICINLTSCAQIHELSQGHCDDNVQDIVFTISYIFVLQSSCFCKTQAFCVS